MLKYKYTLNFRLVSEYENGQFKINIFSEKYQRGKWLYIWIIAIWVDLLWKFESNLRTKKWLLRQHLVARDKRARSSKAADFSPLLAIRFQSTTRKGIKSKHKAENRQKNNFSNVPLKLYKHKAESQQKNNFSNVPLNYSVF